MRNHVRRDPGCFGRAPLLTRAWVEPVSRCWSTSGVRRASVPAARVGEVRAPVPAWEWGSGCALVAVPSKPGGEDTRLSWHDRDHVRHDPGYLCCWDSPLTPHRLPTPEWDGVGGMVSAGRCPDGHRRPLRGRGSGPYVAAGYHQGCRACFSTRRRSGEARGSSTRHESGEVAVP